MDTEIWKAIAGPYRPGYEVSNLGRVRGSIRNRVRGKANAGLCTLCLVTLGGPAKNTGKKDGYYKVSLKLEGRAKRMFVSVHRLVADAFVEGRREETTDVNHKDLNKVNNHWTNLEWVTHSENILHGTANTPGRKERVRAMAQARCRPVEAVDACGGVKWHASGRAAAIAMGNHRRAANIKTAIDGGQFWYGAHWRYAKGPKPECAERMLPSGGTACARILPA